MSDLPSDKVDDAKTVFEVFDKTYSNKVDAYYIGDMIRCLDLSPTQAVCEKHGQTKQVGEKFITFEEFLPIYAELYKMPPDSFGTYEDFIESLKLFDKENNGMMSLAELSQVLVGKAEKLPVSTVEELFRNTDTKAGIDGLFNYETFISKLLSGPFANELL